MAQKNTAGRTSEWAWGRHLGTTKYDMKRDRYVVAKEKKDKSGEQRSKLVPY